MDSISGLEQQATESISNIKRFGYIMQQATESGLGIDCMSNRKQFVLTRRRQAGSADSSNLDNRSNLTGMWIMTNICMMICRCGS